MDNNKYCNIVVLGLAVIETLVSATMIQRDDYSDFTASKKSSAIPQKHAISAYKGCLNLQAVVTVAEIARSLKTSPFSEFDGFFRLVYLYHVGLYDAASGFVRNVID